VAVHATLANKGPRKFYVTPGIVDGAHALTACDAGYHMASLWEIHEPSNLIYNTELGSTLGDSGFGPPDVQGWIRTGQSANDFGNAGAANCNVWTSAFSQDEGTSALLDQNWAEPAVRSSPWQFGSDSCSARKHVWCVQD